LWPWEQEWVKEWKLHTGIVEKFNGNFSVHHFNKITGEYDKSRGDDDPNNELRACSNSNKYFF